MHSTTPCTTQALVDLVDRPARLVVDDRPQSPPCYVVGLVIAVDADARLNGGGSVIVRDDDDGYRIIGLAHVAHVALVEAQVTA